MSIYQLCGKYRLHLLFLVVCICLKSVTFYEVDPICSHRVRILSSWSASFAAQLLFVKFHAPLHSVTVKLRTSQEHLVVDLFGFKAALERLIYCSSAPNQRGLNFLLRIARRYRGRQKCLRVPTVVMSSWNRWSRRLDQVKVLTHIDCVFLSVLILGFVKLVKNFTE